MFALVAIPFILECRYFLSLWLGEVPIYTVIFCQIILLQQLVDKFTWQIGKCYSRSGNYSKLSVGRRMFVFIGNSYWLECIIHKWKTNFNFYC